LGDCRGVVEIFQFPVPVLGPLLIARGWILQLRLVLDTPTRTRQRLRGLDPFNCGLPPPPEILVQGKRLFLFLERMVLGCIGL
jgi:hypothetical protein